ncbi:hypothetical protein [Streptomyces umbrinus]|uniref:hypothetical protein n=1 Tax=Streptomyces umbrinus TaxID=67370 RepID=UPI0027D8E010|nr:hypothetical protein [Streptomyces umbrinus]
MASDQQRHVRRSPLLFTTPLVLLVVLALVLLWEITRGNVTGELSRQWPWRLQLMRGARLERPGAAGGGLIVGPGV